MKISRQKIIKRFARLIKKERKRRKLTLQEVADYIGSSKSYVWELEQGEKEPGLVKVCMLFRFLNLKFHN